MSHLRIPNELYSKTAHLVDAFCEAASVCGYSRSRAESLFRILPLEIKAAPAFLDKIGNCWRYDYGDEIDRLPRNQIALGVHHCPKVEYLFFGMKAAAKRFTDVQMRVFIERLTPSSKHHEVLFELSPLIRIQEDMAASFEVSGLGPGNTTIDWLFVSPNQVPIALEVKYRYKDLVNHLGEIVEGMARSQAEATGGPADPSILFRSLTHKFKPIDPKVRLQGGWIHATIKVGQHDLHQVFSELDQDRLHFAILNTWGPEAYIVARPEVDVALIREVFKLEHSLDFVVEQTEICEQEVQGEPSRPSSALSPEDLVTTFRCKGLTSLQAEHLWVKDYAGKELCLTGKIFFCSLRGEGISISVKVETSDRLLFVDLMLPLTKKDFALTLDEGSLVKVTGTVPRHWVGGTTINISSATIEKV